MGKPVSSASSPWGDVPVFVTGITGFVGASLAARLLKEGARVVGLVRDLVAPSGFERLNLSGRVTQVRGDLTDFFLLERVLAEYSIQVVFHLGAQTIVSIANRSPLSTFRSNIEGTWNLLEACRGKSLLRAIVVASSDKAYGSHASLPYAEDFPLLPQYPYDVSKACADLIARSYAVIYQMPVVVTRFSNIYGPGDLNFSRIVPDTVRSILRGQSPVIRSDGTLLRDYLYVEDAVDLYLRLAEKIDLSRGEVFNAGHSKPMSVLELVRTILQVAEKNGLQPTILGQKTPGEIDRQWLDGEKAKRILSWEPRTPLEEGLRKTFAWYQDFFKPGA